LIGRMSPSQRSATPANRTRWSRSRRLVRDRPSHTSVFAQLGLVAPLPEANSSISASSGSTCPVSAATLYFPQRDVVVLVSEARARAARAVASVSIPRIWSTMDCSVGAARGNRQALASLRHHRKHNDFAAQRSRSRIASASARRSKGFTMLATPSLMRCYVSVDT